MAVEVIGLRAILDVTAFVKGEATYKRGVAGMVAKTATASTSITKNMLGIGASALKMGATLISQAVLGSIKLVTKAILGFGASAIDEGKKFTVAMSNVAAVSGATGAAFEKLTALARELGRTTRYTAIEAAEAQSFLAMAGFEVNDIISALPGTLNLASAAQTDLGKSADIVSNILGGFREEASETGRYVDILTATFTSSNTNLEQLGAAMKFAAPTAAAFGQDVTYVAAALGVFGDSGYQGAIAGTSFRSIMLSLGSPTEIAAKAMRNLGLFTGLTAAEQASAAKKLAAVKNQILELDPAAKNYEARLEELTAKQDQLNSTLVNGKNAFFDLDGNMLPLPQVIGKLKDAMKGLTQEQQAVTLKAIVGTRQFSAFQILLAKGEEGLASYAAELEDSLGKGAEVAAKQMDNLTGDQLLFQSTLSGVKLDLFEKLEPLLRKLTQAGTKMLETLGPGFISFLDTSVFPVIDSLVSKASKLIGAFQRFGARGAAISLMNMLGIGTDTRATILGVIDGIVKKITGLSNVFRMFGAKAGIAFSLVGLLGLEPATVNKIMRVVETVQDKVNKVFGAFKKFGVKGAAISLMSMLGLSPEAISNVMTIIRSFPLQIKETIEGFKTGGLGGGLAAMFGGEGITSRFTAIGGLVTEGLEALWTTIKPTLDTYKERFWEWIPGAVTAAPSKLAAIVRRINTWIVESWPQIEPTLHEWKDKVWDWTKAAAAGAGAALGLIGIAILSWAQSPELQGQIRTLGQNAGQFLIDGINNIASDTNNTGSIVLSLLTGLSMAIVGIAGAIITLGGQFVAGLITGILNALGANLQPAMVSELGSMISGMWSNIAIIAKELGMRIIKDGLLVSIVNTIDDLFPNAFTGTLSRVISAAKGDSGAIRELTSMGLEMATNLVSAARQGLIDATDQIIALGKTVVRGIKQGIKDNIGEVTEIIKSMVKSMISTAGGLLQSHSPSRVFYNFGVDTVLGMINGVSSKAKSLQAKIQEVISGPLGQIKEELNDFVTQAAYGGGLANIRDEKFIDDIQRKMRNNAAELALRAKQLQDSNNLNKDTMQNLIQNLTGVWPSVARDLAAKMFKGNGQVAGILQNLLDSNGKFIEAIAEATKEFNIERLGLGSSLLQLGQTALDIWSTEAESAVDALDKRFQDVDFTNFGESTTNARDLFGEINSLTTKWLTSGMKGFDKLSSEEYRRLQYLKEQALTLAGSQKEYDSIMKTVRELEQVERERAELAKQQANLDFLKQQLDLMKTLAEFGIDQKSIFGDMAFGLDASTEDMVTATKNAIAAIIKAVDEGFQFGSPSKIMVSKGVNAAKSLVRGIGQVDLKTPALNMVKQVTSSAAPQTSYSRTTISNNQRPTFNFSVSNAMDIKIIRNLIRQEVMGGV